MAGTALGDTPSDRTNRNTAQYEDWIRGCSDSGITVVRQDLLVLYVIEVGPDGDNVTQCLLSRRDPATRNQVADSEAAVADSWPFDVVMFSDGTPSRRTEALIQTDTRVLIVSGRDSEGGVEKMEFLSGSAFVVQTAHATHRRAYLLSLDSAELAYLTNGTVEILDREALTFRVVKRKSYFKELGGAFWFDAIVDRDGNILDVVTESSDCMSREELARQSSLDLTRVAGSEVCIYR